jgi:hypothetical protein
MSREGKGLLTAAARIVCRRWRALAWAYGANLLLSLAATIPAALSVSGILDNSFESQRLVKGFDVTVLLSLLERPEVSLRGSQAGSLFFSLVYFLFMLFLTGGLLRDFCGEQRLSIKDFFAACGEFFWRFVRLALVLAILMVPFAIAFGFVADKAKKLSSDAASELTGFRFFLAGTLVVYLLVVALRLWFDVAQVRAVIEDEPKIRRALRKSFVRAFANLLPLFWIYLRTSALAWAGWAAAFLLWVRYVRPESIGWSFLLGQSAVLLWIVTRFWQRAGEILWYQRKFPSPPPVLVVEPAPLESVISREGTPPGAVDA